MLSFLIIYLFLIIKTSNDDKITEFRKFEHFKNDKLRRILQEETDMDSYPCIIYNITNIIYSFENQKLNLYVNSNPELPNYTDLLVKLKIDKYDYSLGYWEEKENEIRASFGNLTTGVYSAFIDEMTLDNLTYNINITILNVSVLSYDNNIYYLKL